MFLSIDDYKSVCDDFEFETLQADQYRTTAENAAIEQISGYIRSRYDTAKVFALNGDDRNPMVVQAAVNITLWLMVHRLPQQMGVERRQLLYEESVQWLKDIQAGKASPGLPTYVSDDGSDDDTHNPIRYGCVPPSKYDW